MNDLPAGLAEALTHRDRLEAEVGSREMATVYHAEDLVSDVVSR